MASSFGSSRPCFSLRWLISCALSTTTMQREQMATFHIASIINPKSSIERISETSPHVTSASASSDSIAHSGCPLRDPELAPVQTHILPESCPYAGPCDVSDNLTDAVLAIQVGQAYKSPSVTVNG
ncbi:hypothetical protein V1523DRAFT_181099 [Lipomyces doorenjongii]